MKEGLVLFANPRNAVSGSLRLQDPRDVARRNLNAWFYQISYVRGKDGKNMMDSIATQDNSISILHSIGFKTPYRDLKTTDSIKSVLKICEEWKRKRENFDFEIDGLVIKVNDLSLHKRLGLTSHHPRWAMAYKFEPREGTTILRGVHFEVGRTGAITPVAILDPVHIGGVTISSASLHNEDFIKEKDIRINDTVMVERAGDVIPYIVKPVIDNRVRNVQKIKFPKNCPSCGSRLMKQANESVWRCINMDCPAQVERCIIHFASKDAMDIQGLGDRTIKRLFREKIIGSIPDIYDINFSKMLKLEGFGNLAVNNLKQSIEESKNRPLHKVITGLGIRFVGERTARTLANVVRCIPDLATMSKKELAQLPDVGDKVAESILNFFKRKENIKVLDRLEKYGVKICRERKTIRKGSKFAGLTFVFTGSLDNYSRDEAKRFIEDNGGETAENISAKVNYVVVGKDPGLKLQKARRIKSIRIINEKEFLKLPDI